MADEKNNDNLGMVKAAAAGAGGNILSQAMAMATRGWENKQQLKQQKKLQELGIAGSKEMGRFNQELALDLWEKTNYDAQRKQLQKAGLNVGLMYEGGGAGGTTSGGAAGNVSGGQATAASALPQGMGMQIGLQMQMQAAQIENIKADTKQKNVQAAKEAGVDTEAVKAQIEATRVGIENMKQQTKNAKVQQQINTYEAKLKEIMVNVAKDTADTQIKQVGEQYKLLKAQVELQEKTNPELIKQARQTTMETALRMQLIEKGILKADMDIIQANAAIDKIAAEIVRMKAQTEQGDRALDQKHQDQIIEMMEKEFKYGDKYNLKVLIDQIDKVIPF